MTAYHGGKQRIGKQLAEVIVDRSKDIAEEEGFEINGYCEPFCGMLGVYRHIPELLREEGFDELDYLAGDANESVVLMWQAAQKGWRPPAQCSYNEYKRLESTHRASRLKGFIGHQCSFGGKYFQGFSKKYDTTKNPEKASKRVSEIATGLKSVDITHGIYSQFSNLKGYIVYCDPPYSKFNKYYDESKHELKFDTERFWDWCHRMSRNNIVMVSEYSAPPGVRSISEFRHTSCHRGNVKNNKEILYLVENQ
jgi:DNA adenine methylase